MSNGDDRFFLFIERGTDPTVSGIDAPVNSICTFRGTIYRKIGEGPTEWEIYPTGGGGFTGGVVPDPVEFLSGIAFRAEEFDAQAAYGRFGRLGVGADGIGCTGVLDVDNRIEANSLDVGTNGVGARFQVTAAGQIRIGTIASDPIREYGTAAGVGQGAFIPDATDATTAIASLNALLAYFRARGTIAP